MSCIEYALEHAMMSRPATIEVADARDRLAIARILKVNHAGEYGAIRIYRAQVLVARRFYPDVVAFLEETLAHEINHCAMFRNAMPTRDVRPCRATVLWAMAD
jgi:3-demethoxyubiquinol 3-hydroxylase